MIKLLALDLDGTTLDPQGNVADETRRAIRSAEAMGVLVTIATGRRFRDAQPVGLDLELNAPLITHNGALIKYADGGEPLAVSLLPSDTASLIVETGKNLGGDALVSTDPHGKGTLLFDNVAEDNFPLRRYLAWAIRLHGEEEGRSAERVDNLKNEVAARDVIHISYSGTCGKMEKLQNDLAHELGNAVTILATIYPKLDFTLLDLLPPDSSKGHGVAKLAERIGVTPAEVMCIGDNHNDMAMLEYAGVPVVMGNAEPDLLQRTEFYKTLSNAEHGVAAAINRFIFDQEK